MTIGFLKGCIIRIAMIGYTPESFSKICKVMKHTKTVMDLILIYFL